MNLVYAVIFIPRVIGSFQLLSPPTSGLDNTSHDDTKTVFHMQLSLTSSAQILSEKREWLLLSPTPTISSLFFGGMAYGMQSNLPTSKNK